MKKLFFITAVLITTSILLSSCSKYNKHDMYKDSVPYAYFY